MIHYWHDVSPGPHPPEEITAVVEIPFGSRNKYELDKKTGLMKLDRKRDQRIQDCSQHVKRILYLRPFARELAARDIHELVQHLNADHAARGQ